MPLVCTPKRKSSPYFSIPAKTASRQSIGSAPWKMICGRVPRGRCFSKYPLQNAQGFDQPCRRHVFPFPTHRFRDVAIGAIEVAPVRRVEVDRRQVHSEPECLHFRQESGPFTVLPKKGAAGERSTEFRLLHQRPESRIGIQQGDIVGVADVDRLNRGTVSVLIWIPREDAASPSFLMFATFVSFSRVMPCIRCDARRQRRASRSGRAYLPFPSMRRKWDKPVPLALHFFL